MWSHQMGGSKDSLIAADLDHRFGDAGSVCTSCVFQIVSTFHRSWPELSELYPG
jgi:hypothetical protein